MRLGVVVQRYGANINGGAERHARYIAEHLARHHEIEVLTTCARDYVTWRDEFAPGVETVHGIPNNVPGATGARWPTVLGKISP